MPAPSPPAALKPLLVVMRRSNMTLVHPEMIISNCHRCREPVGVYPSGQRIVRKFDVELVCEVCYGPVTSLPPLAPGAREETRESVPAPAPEGTK